MRNRIIVSLLFLCLVPTACRGQGVDPELTAAVDSMLPKLEVLAGLKKLKPVTLAEQSREELRSYVESRLTEELPPRELEGIKQTYVALGLVPDTLDLRALLLDLYQEQVAGYYDPHSEKFYMLKGTPAAMLRPVLAHELVHALQDQHADLDSLISRDRGNDRQTAAQSAIEGHATIVMFAYMAQELTGQALDQRAMPDIGAQLRPALEAQNSQFPVFRRAPRIIRETMIFPYVGGAVFVQKLWAARSDLKYPAPFGTLLPQSSEQILHPVETFLTLRDAPVELRFEKRQNVIYENTLGELETGIFLSEHLGVDAQDAARGWAGDRYQLLNSNGANVLVWQSVWDDAPAADLFASRYREIGERRNRSVRVERNTVDGKAGVLVFDAQRGFDVGAIPRPVVRTDELSR